MSSNYELYKNNITITQTILDDLVEEINFRLGTDYNALEIINHISELQNTIAPIIVDGTNWWISSPPAQIVLNNVDPVRQTLDFTYNATRRNDMLYWNVSPILTNISAGFIAGTTNLEYNPEQNKFFITAQSPTLVSDVDISGAVILYCTGNGDDQYFFTDSECINRVTSRNFPDSKYIVFPKENSNNTFSPRARSIAGLYQVASTEGFIFYFYNFTSISGSNVFDENVPGLKEVYFPNAITANFQGFNYCSKLEKLEMPKLVSLTIGGHSFLSVPNLTEINLPKLKSLEVTNNYIADDGTSFTINAPELETFNCVSNFVKEFSLYIKITFNCPNLKYIPSGLSTTTTGNNGFWALLVQLSKRNFNYLEQCGALTCKAVTGSGRIDFNVLKTLNKLELKIRSGTPKLVFNSEEVITLQNPCDPTMHNVPIYVPDELLEDYKTGTNWSLISDYIYPISDLESA